MLYTLPDTPAQHHTLHHQARWQQKVHLRVQFPVIDKNNYIFNYNYILCFHAIRVYVSIPNWI